MPRHFLGFPLLLAALLGACSTTGTDRADAPASERSAPRAGLLPTPKGSLELAASAGTNSPTLHDLLGRVSEKTGVTFSTTPATQQSLQQTKAQLNQAARVSGDEIYTWVESILLQNGYVLSLLEVGDAPLVGVHSKNERNQAPQPYRIDSEQLDLCRIHPAILFSTVLDLPNTDVRSVGNSLRILAPDSQTGGVVPVGMTNSVILSGTGGHVLELAGLLRIVDDKAAVQRATAASMPVQGPAKQ